MGIWLAENDSSVGQDFKQLLTTLNLFLSK